MVPNNVAIDCALLCESSAKRCHDCPREVTRQRLTRRALTAPGGRARPGPALRATMAAVAAGRASPDTGEPGGAFPGRQLPLEGGSIHLRRDSGPVQVGRDAAEVERPPGAEDHAQVDVLGGRDHALVEHDPDLLGQALKGTRENLGPGRGTV